MTFAEASDKRIKAAKQLGVSFNVFTDRNQALDDLLRLCSDKDSAVREEAINSLAVVFPYIQDKEQVWEKVKEEINELCVEIENVDKDKIEGEFGDLFFAMVNAARLYGIDPEAALERTNLKFIKRFNYLESQTLQKGLDLKKMSLAEMDVIWDEAKRLERL